MRITNWLIVSAIAFFGFDIYAEGPDDPHATPLATIDLGGKQGAALVKGQWRYSDARIVDADFFAPGPEGQPTGMMIKAQDISPRAGGKQFDDSKWEAIEPQDIMQRRTHGRLASTGIASTSRFLIASATSIRQAQR